MADMAGKTVLVTGATSGIGEATAQALAQLGARVFVHGRNRQKGIAVVEAIRRLSGNPAVEFVEGDFASLASVRALASEMKRRAPKLDVLINNAGRASLRRASTVDGFECMFGVNHLAPFLFTNLILDTLKASAPSRIVIVASDAHRGTPLDFGNLNFEKGGYRTKAAYHASKLANMLFAFELARRLQASGVTVNALHPGVVRTGIGMDRLPSFARAIGRLLTLPLLPPQEGAKTSVYLASAPELATVSGHYFYKCRPIEPDPVAVDEAAAKTLWALSAKMTGLTA